MTWFMHFQLFFLPQCLCVPPLSLIHLTPHFQCHPFLPVCFLVDYKLHFFEILRVSLFTEVVGPLQDNVVNFILLQNIGILSSVPTIFPACQVASFEHTFDCRCWYVCNFLLTISSSSCFLKPCEGFPCATSMKTTYTETAPPRPPLPGMFFNETPSHC